VPGEARSEFVVNEPKELVDFYEQVLGYPALTYNETIGSWIVQTNKLNAKGEVEPYDFVVTERQIRLSTSMIGNFWVDDLTEFTRRVIENKGHIYIEKGEEGTGLDIIEIENVGRQRYFCDPEGNMFGAIEPFKKDKH
jgi:predicted enzyme related to lactoylglutathione lyase